MMLCVSLAVAIKTPSLNSAVNTLSDDSHLPDNPPPPAVGSIFSALLQLASIIKADNTPGNINLLGAKNFIFNPLLIATPFNLQTLTKGFQLINHARDDRKTLIPEFLIIRIQAKGL